MLHEHARGLSTACHLYLVFGLFKIGYFTGWDSPARLPPQYPGLRLSMMLEAPAESCQKHPTECR